MVKVIFVSVKNLHPQLTNEQIDTLKKNPKKFYHILECEGRVLWIKHRGSSTKQGAATHADFSLQHIAHIKAYPYSVNADYAQEAFKFLGLPVPRNPIKVDQENLLPVKKF